MIEIKYRSKNAESSIEAAMMSPLMSAFTIFKLGRFALFSIRSLRISNWF